jgi:hypothetical protein
MDGDKLETIRNWSREKKTKNGRLNNIFEVQQFVGFCKYYQQFMSKYSEKVEPLTRLTKMDEPLVWESEQQWACENMINAFTTAPTAPHFDQQREVTIETDASNYVSPGVLLQQRDEGILHPVANYWKKHSPAECSHNMYAKELMSIIQALVEWRPECEGAPYPLQLITEHKNLNYCVAKKLLNRQQARSSECVTRFEYHIVCRP